MLSKKNQLISLLQMAFAVLAAGSLVLVAAILVFWEHGKARAAGDYTDSSTPVFILAGVLLGISLLLLPSVYYGWKRLRGEPAIDSLQVLRRLKPGYWILALPILIFLGTLVSQSSPSSSILLPPIHFLAVFIPTAWILFLALHRLPAGSSQRFWGIFDIGITLIPLLIMVCEVLALIALGFILIGVLISQPELLKQLSEMAEQARTAGSPDDLKILVNEYMKNPYLISLTVFYIALVVPVIEEAIKPLGVWFLFGRRLSPAAGFAAGTLSGAGYGLVENLLLSGNSQEWGVVVLARIGTTAVHILTAGLMGWAIVQIWSKKRVLPLLFAFTAAVVIHGAWNGLTVLSAFHSGGFLEGFSATFNGLPVLGAAAPIALSLLASGCFLLLLVINRKLRRTLPENPVSHVQDPPPVQL